MILAIIYILAFALVLIELELKPRFELNTQFQIFIWIGTINRKKIKIL